jgi:hypothetical protein
VLLPLHWVARKLVRQRSLSFPWRSDPGQCEDSLDILLLSRETAKGTRIVKHMHGDHRGTLIMFIIRVSIFSIFQNAQM